MYLTGISGCNRYWVKFISAKGRGTAVLGEDRGSVTLPHSLAETTTGYMGKSTKNRENQTHPSLPPPTSTQESLVQDFPLVRLVWDPRAPTHDGFIYPLDAPLKHPVLQVSITYL